MKQEDLIKELGEIRSIMEKSSKFFSISGLSGVLIGCYAFIGAALAYTQVYGFQSQLGYRDFYVTDSQVVYKLIAIGIGVLVCAIITGFVMARQKAKRHRQNIWNASSRNLLFSVAIPLLTGGAVALIFISKGWYGTVASTLLIFYGLALTSGSVFTFKEVKWLGLFEILLGIGALVVPGYGLFFWAFGFGVLHIIYGAIVYKRYER